MNHNLKTAVEPTHVIQCNICVLVIFNLYKVYINYTYETIIQVS